MPYSLSTTTTLPFFSTLTEDFNDNSLDFDKWGYWGSYDAGVAETSQQLELTTKAVNGAYFGLITDLIYNLTGSSVFVEVVNQGNQTLESFEGYPLTLTDAAESNYIEFNIIGGVLNVYKRVSDVSTKLAFDTFDSVNHRFLRIREDSWNYLLGYFCRLFFLDKLSFGS